MLKLMNRFYIGDVAYIEKGTSDDVDTINTLNGCCYTGTYSELGLHFTTKLTTEVIQVSFVH